MHEIYPVLYSVHHQYHFQPYEDSLIFVFIYKTRMKQNRFSIRIHSMNFFFCDCNVTYVTVNKSNIFKSKIMYVSMSSISTISFVSIETISYSIYKADSYFEVMAAATRIRELTQKFYTSVNSSDSGQLVSCTSISFHLPHQS